MSSRARKTSPGMMVFLPPLSVCSFALARELKSDSLRDGASAELLSRQKDVRVGQVVDEYDGALGHGQYGVALDLGVGRQDALGQPCDDGLGQSQVLRSGSGVSRAAHRMGEEQNKPR